MCSMKWATPASSGFSSLEPASTYAATDTERDPGTRALITRGPSASAVRWNTLAMVQGTGPHGPRPEAARTDGARSAVPAQRCAPHLDRGYMMPNDPRTTASSAKRARRVAGQMLHHEPAGEITLLSQFCAKYTTNAAATSHMSG